MGPYVIIALILLVVIILIRSIRIVQQAKAYVIERLGAYKETWNVGFHIKMPFIEKVAKIVSLKEQVADFPPQPVITKDNVTMQIDTVVYFQITDPKMYTYGIEHPMVAIENLAATTLRNIIGDLEPERGVQQRGDKRRQCAKGKPDGNQPRDQSLYHQKNDHGDKPYNSHIHIPISPFRRRTVRLFLADSIISCPSVFRKRRLRSNY